jgi:hypothetical protein
MKCSNVRALSGPTMYKFLCIMLLVISTMPSRGIAQMEPRMEIQIQQEQDQVIFEFFIRDTIFFFLNKRTPLGISSLLVNDSKRKPIWSIQLVKPDASGAVKKITYGVVPEGFHQHEPAVGPAPNLEHKGQYEVWASWGGGAGGRVVFIYEGK